PLMTVRDVRSSADPGGALADVDWFDGNQPHGGSYPLTSLEDVVEVNHAEKRNGQIIPTSLNSDHKLDVCNNGAPDKHRDERISCNGKSFDWLPIPRLHYFPR